MMSGYCSDCGQPLAVGAGFCSKCGAAVSQRPDYAAPRAAQPNIMPPPLQPSSALNRYDYRQPEGFGYRPDRDISGLGWMIEPFRRYADFNGRSRRKEYWSFTLLWWVVTIVALVMIIAGMPDVSAAEDRAYAIRQGMAAGPEPTTGIIFWVGLVLWLSWWLVAFIPSCAVIVRRLHDSDKSGWLLALFFVVNFLFSLLGLILQAVFMFMDGTRGPNQYGEDPKNQMPGDIFR